MTRFNWCNHTVTVTNQGEIMGRGLATLFIGTKQSDGVHHLLTWSGNWFDWCEPAEGVSRAETRGGGVGTLTFHLPPKKAIIVEQAITATEFSQLEKLQAYLASLGRYHLDCYANLLRIRTSNSLTAPQLLCITDAMELSVQLVIDLKTAGITDEVIYALHSQTSLSEGGAKDLLERTAR